MSLLFQQPVRPSAQPTPMESVASSAPPAVATKVREALNEGIEQDNAFLQSAIEKRFPKWHPVRNIDSWQALRERIATLTQAKTHAASRFLSWPWKLGTPEHALPRDTKRLLVFGGVALLGLGIYMAPELAVAIDAWLPEATAVEDVGSTANTPTAQGAQGYIDALKEVDDEDTRGETALSMVDAFLLTNPSGKEMMAFVKEVPIGSLDYPYGGYGNNTAYRFKTATKLLAHAPDADTYLKLADFKTLTGKNPSTLDSDFSWIRTDLSNKVGNTTDQFLDLGPTEYQKGQLLASPYLYESDRKALATAITKRMAKPTATGQ